MERATAGPVTTDEIKRANLDLQREVIKIKDDAEIRRQNFELEMERIQASIEKQKVELELKYSSIQGTSEARLESMYKELEEKAEKAKSDLSFGLEEKELEYKQKLEELETEFKLQEEECNTKLEELKSEIIFEESNNVLKLSDISKKYDRELEEMDYNHRIAKRDKNLETAKEIASNYEMSLVEDSHLAHLTGEKELSDEELNTKIENAVKEATNKVYREEGSKYSKLKNESESKIALLENDKSHLEGSLKAAQLRIESLENKYLKSL